VLFFGPLPGLVCLGGTRNWFVARDAAAHIPDQRFLERGPLAARVGELVIECPCRFGGASKAEGSQRAAQHVRGPRRLAAQLLVELPGGESTGAALCADVGAA
jgi:hypothetical protein